MKNFTKGCLITAMVLFILGCLICTVCGVLGGFRQITSGALNGIAGIPFFCNWQEDGGFSLGFFSDDWEEDAFWEKGDWQQVDNTGTKQKLAVTKDSMRQLFLEMADCNLKIEESSDDSIWLSCDDDMGRTYYKVEKDSADKDILSIRNTRWRRDRDWSRTSANIKLYLPKGCDLDLMNIMVGAGYMDAVSLKADSILINVGAGVCEAKELEADRICLTVDAGQMNAAKLAAREAVMQIGAGELTVHDIDVREFTDVDIDLGNAEITGTLAGCIEAECDLGNLKFRLTGSEDDYGFDVDCGMGDIKIGNHHYSGFGDSSSWNIDKKNQIEISCDMGNITVTFDK